MSTSLHEQWNALNQAQRKQLIHAYRHKEEDDRIPQSAVIHSSTLLGKGLSPYIRHGMGRYQWEVHLTPDGVVLSEFAIENHLVPKEVFYLLPPSDDADRMMYPRYGASVMMTNDPVVRDAMLNLGWKLTRALNAEWRIHHMRDYYWDAR